MIFLAERADKGTGKEAKTHRADKGRPDPPSLIGPVPYLLQLAGDFGQQRRAVGVVDRRQVGGLD